MASFQVRRLAYALGAEITGLDLRAPLDDETIAAIRKAWLEHIFVCFPGQPLDRRELFAFATRFGGLEVIKNPENRDPDSPHITVLTEKAKYGKPWHGYKNGQDWHSDNSHTTHPSDATFLSCKEIPAAGGDTIFANTYMAYAALSPAMRRIVDGLEAVHGRALVRGGAGSPGGLTGSLREIVDRASSDRSAIHPIARVHPETGRKALYVGVRARRIDGMTEEESRPLLAFLNEHVVSYEFTYRHRWRVDDLVMWDNRCSLHIALSDYDLQRDPRLMIRCAVMGAETGRYAEAHAMAATS